MKRRDFFKNTAITALGTTFLGPLSALAGTTETHLESEDLSERSQLKDDYPVHFLALGDWGRNGADHQLPVARQMGKWATDNPNDFIMALGDNFYPRGVVSEHDPLWHYSFESIYTEFPLQWDWYPILGNHDYMGDPDAQVRYSKVSRRWVMPSRYYSKEVSLKGKGKLLLLFIDTNPLIPEFADNAHYGPNVAGQQPEKQLAWIDKKLSEASADVKWTMVIGHHPIYTVGPRIKNYDTLAVRKALEDVLKSIRSMYTCLVMTILSSTWICLASPRNLFVVRGQKLLLLLLEYPTAGLRQLIMGSCISQSMTTD